MAIGVKVRKGSATNARARRHFRVRKKVSGTSARPRLVVSRSARHLFVQVVDDSQSRTVVSASTMEADLRVATGDKSAKARQVGVLIAQRAKAAEYFGFDAILISGPVAGVAYSSEDLLAAKETAKKIPVFANTGVNATTIADTLKIADGVIAGSSMKVDGKTFNPVDPKRVIELVSAANKSR